MAELPDSNVMKPSFKANTNALNNATQHLGRIRQEMQNAAVANTIITVQVSRLPQDPTIQGQAIMAMIQEMRDEFRARFVKGPYLLRHTANLS